MLSSQSPVMQFTEKCLDKYLIPEGPQIKNEPQVFMSSWTFKRHGTRPSLRLIASCQNLSPHSIGTQPSWADHIGNVSNCSPLVQEDIVIFLVSTDVNNAITTLTQPCCCTFLVEAINPHRLSRLPQTLNWSGSEITPQKTCNVFLFCILPKRNIKLVGGFCVSTLWIRKDAP